MVLLLERTTSARVSGGVGGEPPVRPDEAPRSGGRAALH